MTTFCRTIPFSSFSNSRLRPLEPLPLYFAIPSRTYIPIWRHSHSFKAHGFSTTRYCLSTSRPKSRRTSTEDLFNYTSGRFLYNENIRLAERHVEFNVEALKTAAAECVGRKGVTHLEKLAEGGFSRVFLLTMDDGFEVIAKIPYSFTVPKGLTTESEVATLDFLRSKGIPVPRVYAYSSKSDNPVGTEYIIMEKAPGKPLEECWFTLTPKDRVRLVTSYVDIETKLFSIPFGAYGSLYYKDCLPQNLQPGLYAPGMGDGVDGTGERFSIGPSTDYMFWRGNRASLDLHRGPWRNQLDYIRSIGIRELEWTRRFGKPLENDFPQNNIVKGKVDPKLHLDLLDKYISISPFILPEDRASPMNTPTMRHPADLTPSNIFVSDSCEISCIIDWQHTTILPLLLTAGNPPLFENPDSGPPKNLEKPSLPEDYASLPPEEKAYADELHRRRMLFYLYMVFNGRDNQSHLDALYYPLLALRQHLVTRAEKPWSGNIVTLKGALIRLVACWDQLIADRGQHMSCPVHFDPSDVEEFYQLEENWFKMNILTEHWLSLLDDLGQDGWVRNESYDSVVQLNQQLRREWVAEAEAEADNEAEAKEDVASVENHWPFQDHEEFD
ncbi:hypothetical protein L228DRAFT_224932, partial [Xylona heveae TC161]